MSCLYLTFSILAQSADFLHILRLKYRKDEKGKGKGGRGVGGNLVRNKKLH